MAKRKVLVVDDDPLSLGAITALIEEGGFECISFRRAEEAMDHLRGDPSIGYGIIDSLLYEPGSDQELQDMQGEDVIQEIARERPDVVIIMVTSVPRQAAKSDEQNGLEKYLQTKNALESIPGVVSVLDKGSLLESSTHGTPNSGKILIELLNRTAPREQSHSNGPTRIEQIIVGLGVSPDLFQFGEQKSWKEQRLSRMIDRKRFEITQPLSFLTEFVKQVTEKANGSIEKKVEIVCSDERLISVSNLPTRSPQGFQILLDLAVKAEAQKLADLLDLGPLDEPLLVRKEEYAHRRRGAEILTAPARTILPAQQQDLIYSGSSDDPQSSNGIQQKPPARPSDPLKTAISRLRAILNETADPSREKAKREEIFTYLPQEKGYRPEVEMLLHVYPVANQM